MRHIKTHQVVYSAATDCRPVGRSVNNQVNNAALTKQVKFYENVGKTGFLLLLLALSYFFFYADRWISHSSPWFYQV